MRMSMKKRDVFVPKKEPKMLNLFVYHILVWHSSRNRTDAIDMNAIKFDWNDWRDDLAKESGTWIRLNEVFDRIICLFRVAPSIGNRQPTNKRHEIIRNDESNVYGPNWKRAHKRGIVTIRKFAT